MIIIESGLLEEVRVSAAIEHFKRRNHDKPFHKVLKVLKPDVIINLVEDGQQKKYTFVIENFAGNLFRRLEQCQDSVILGKTIFVEAMERGQPLPQPKRPLYCNAFAELECVFNTMTKTRLIELVNLVHWMGGHVREQIDKGQCDRLVANHLRGPKFRRAVSLDIPIVNCDYVMDCWTLMRQLPFFRASDKDYTAKYKRRAFETQRIYHAGYTEDDSTTFDRFIVKGGGEVTTSILDATHLMIAPGYRSDDVVRFASIYQQGGMRGPPEAPWCVTEQWLWNSIRIDARVGEKHYFPAHLVGEKDEIETEETITPSSPSEAETVTPEKCSRKRNNETLKSSSSNLSLQSETSDSEFNTEAELSSILSRTVIRAELYSPKSSPQSQGQIKTRSFTEPSIKSQRISVAGELLNTEINYVRILKILCHKYKAGLENENQSNGAILNATESNLIFGNIPELLRIHEALLNELQIVIDELTIGKNRSLGKCFLNHTQREHFGKCYSSYIQFMKQSKFEVDRMKDENDRFFAFLKVVEKENKDDQIFKQGFDSLLKAPMQRLLRYPMLLERYKKEAELENVDKCFINEIDLAIRSIKVISGEANEAKRTTDGYANLAQIFHEIEDCPAILFNARRKLITEVKGVVVSNCATLKVGDKINLFIFKDCIEIAKRKRKAMAPSSSRASLHHVMTQSNNNLSPYGTASGSTSHHGPYLQHRELVNFAPGADSKHLKYLDTIYDVIETEKHQHCLALMTRSGHVPPIVSPFQLNNVISFQLDHTVDKTALLGQLKQLIIDERRQTNFGDENFDEQMLVEQMEGKRLKIEDTNLIRRGLFRTMSRKMSFSRPPVPSFGDNYDTQSLVRYDSQMSINSTSSRMSVKSAFTKSPTKLFQKSRGMSFQTDSRSMLNLPDIPKGVSKTFTKPLRKIFNNFTKPSQPKEQ